MELVTTLAVALVFKILACFIVPAADKYHEAGYDTRSKAGHCTSVIMHTVQFIEVTVILVRLGR